MSGVATTAGVAQTWPLSPEQRAASGAGGTFVLELALEGPFDEAALKAALSKAASCHDVLASAFVSVSGYRGLRSLTLTTPAAVAWTVRDLRDHADPEAELRNDVETLRDASLDLARGETLRASLWRLGDETWRLAVAASPLVADRTTLALIEQDLARSVSAEKSSPEAATYAQYADWRREMEADEDAPRGRRYWRELAADAATPPVPAYRRNAEAGARCSRSVEVEPRIAGGFAALAGEAGVEIALQAAWWALVARVTGLNAFLAGWRHDCRRDYEMFAPAAGPFEKVIPVRVAIDADASFANFLKQHAAALAGHLEWQEHLTLDGAEAVRGPSVGFGLDVAPAFSGGSRRVSLEGPSPFELELRPEIDHAGALTSLSIGWDEGRYGAEAAETLLEQMVTLIASIVESPTAPIASLAVVGPLERDRLLKLDRTGVTPAGRASLLPAILGWVERTPQAPALSGEGETLDYATLGQRVERVARALVARGAVAETIVALDLPRSVDMVVALLAVWRAGAAYLPLDPEWPSARRRQLCSAAGVSIVIHAGLADAGYGPISTLSFADALAGSDEASLPHAEPPADRAAYVLFTSGSTGAPKGVVVEHGQIASYVAAVRDTIGLGERRRFALTSTVAADLGNTTLFGALAGGACLFVATDAQARQADAFAAFLRKNEIDCAKLAPSHLAALLEGEDPAVPATLILGGEPTPQALASRVRSIAPDCRIFNHYGPTETTVGVLVHAAAPTEIGALPLTRALDGNVILVLDETGRLAPTGSVGHLHVGGAQLCRGYLDADGAGFVDDPLTPSRKLYPTGDLARYRPEGGVEIVGRADRQAKINGHRVEPGEVEAALAALDGVRQAAVDLRREAEGGATLTAFVTAAAGVDAAALRAQLAERLPAPMVPGRIVVVDRMPLLGNGKVDRAALATRAVDDAPAAAPPRDALETALRDLAAELLGRKPEALGVTDDFFEVGGNSLLVIKFVARIRKLFDLELPPGIVFDHPNVASLAGALREKSPDGRLERVAGLRLKLAGLSEEERAALLTEASAKRSAP